MKNTHRIIALAIAICSFAFTAEAQNVGYINSQLLLSEMAEVKQARTNLETLATQLRKRLEGQVTDLQKKAQLLQAEYDKGELSPQQAENKRVELQNEEQVLAKTEQEMSQQVAQKEQALLQPILDRVNLIIETVAKENGYSYVFDLSQGSLLYYDEAHDLMSKVKARL